MVHDAARVSVAATPAAIGTCDLCLTENTELAAAVVVRHSHGGTVQFAACERCARGLRRIVAAIGGHGDAVWDQIAPVVDPPPLSQPALVHRPVLIREVQEALADGHGAWFVTRLYGEPRADGTWIGWIEFQSAASGAVLRTGRETTQSNQEQLVYWASGLGTAYFEGALERAR